MAQVSAKSLGGYSGRLSMTTYSRLKATKEALETKLGEINKALALLDENPKLTELLEAVERAGY